MIVPKGDLVLGLLSLMILASVAGCLSGPMDEDDGAGDDQHPESTGDEDPHTGPLPTGEQIDTSGEQLGAYVVVYEIFDNEPHRHPKAASAGDHCALAHKDDGTLLLELRTNYNASDSPWLAVFPTIPADWSPGWGAQPFHEPIPTTVDPGIHDDNTMIGDFRLNGNDTLLLDGVPLTFPHTWNVTAEDDSWRAEATVYEWEGEIRLMEARSCF